MPGHAYTKGLHDLGNAVYAYLQPDGTWGWSNAGLISDGDASLLIDTLFDLHLTQEMLATMRKAVPAAAEIDLVVNTHANGDHCYGNQLVANAKIIASQRTTDEMQHGIQPGTMALLMKQAPMMGSAGAYFLHAFRRFNFEGISVTLPKETFEGELMLRVDSKPVHLLEVGPAHTQGDTMVYLPDEKVIFTGDILFIGGHPIVWAGPVGNWLRACDRILALDVDVIVPGHGPITDTHGVAEVKGYLEYVYGEARKRYDAGMSAAEAARDIPMDRYATWTDGERIAVNIVTCYREFSGEQDAPNALALFAMMGALLEERQA
jgi:cyclase